MNFTLDPSSGFADSYLDVEFSVVVPDHPKTAIRIYNETSQEQLQILGTSFGYILNGDQVILKEQNSTTGHINIFNEDKMNKKFLSYHSVILKCRAEFYDAENVKVGEEEESIVFYNEMYSLDADIIPFDLILHNKTVDITNNEPLSLDIISDIPKKYELCIGSLDETIRCHIEVAARAGKTSIEIPAEFLYYDLRLNQVHKKFKFFYIKYQGTTMSRLMNKRYLPIKDSDLNFQISEKLTPKPQSRLDPVGRPLSKNFIISDRYLVMCPKEHSGFARKNEFGKEKLMDLTMMVREGQYMRSLAKQIQQFENKDTGNIQNMQRSLQLTNQAQKNIQRPSIAPAQINLMKNVSKIYDQISSKINTPEHPRKAVQTFASKLKPTTGCAPCSRKRKQNA